MAISLEWYAAFMDKTGGSMHPTSQALKGGGFYTAYGLTIRDWFAGQALATLELRGSTPLELAGCAYEIADAMLAQSRKEVE